MLSSYAGFLFRLTIYLYKRKRLHAQKDKVEVVVEEHGSPVSLLMFVSFMGVEVAVVVVRVSGGVFHQTMPLETHSEIATG